MRRELTLVIVTGAFELQLLELTARSFASWSNQDVIREIVVVPLLDDADFHRECETAVRDSFPSRISVSVRPVPVATRWSDGDRAPSIRQAAAVIASESVRSDYYVSIDAGDLAFSPIDLSSFFTEGDRGIVRASLASDYAQNSVARTMKHLGMDPVRPSRLQTGTPFVLQRSAARALRERLGDVDTESLLSTALACRWFLPASALIERERAHALEPRCVDVDDVLRIHVNWPRDDQALEQEVARHCVKGKYAFAAMDPRRFAKLLPQAREAIRRLWELSRALPEDANRASTLATEVIVSSPHFDPQPQVEGGARRGPRGRMYIEEGSNRVADQHRGLVDLASDFGRSWRRLLVSRHALCAALGSEYAFLIAPDNQSVYRQEIGDLSQHGIGRPVTRVLRETRNLPYVCYPLSSMIAQAGGYSMTDSSDSHWSGAGAFVAYRELLRQTGTTPHILGLDDLEFYKKRTRGDLGSKFSPEMEGTTTDYRIHRPRARRVWQNGVTNRGFMAFWHNRIVRKLPRALLLMDSYGWRLQPLLAESFSWMFVVHSPYYEWEIVEHFRPDVVVQVMAERFLLRLPNDISHESAADAAITKNPVAAIPRLEELLAMDSKR